MKNTLLAVIAAFTLCFTGCETSTSLPSVETIASVSKVVGTTSGYACELSKTKTSVKEGIVSVLKIASTVVPGTNETFVAAWTPVVATESEKLVQSGKITSAEATLIKTAMNTACVGLDFVFTKYPVAKTYNDLVATAITNFTDGFVAVVNANGSVASTKASEDENKIANEFKAYLKSHSGTK